MELGIKDLMQIIRKKSWWLVSIVIMATLAAGYISFYVLQPTYEASSQIIVNSTSATGQPTISLNEVSMDLRLIDTYKEIIKSVSMMKKVTNSNSQLGHTPEHLSSTVKVSSADETQMITISYQNSSYENAAQTVNAIAQVFKREMPTLMKADNVSILGLADEDAKPAPFSPKPVFIVAVTFVVSLVLSIAFFVFIEFMDDTVKSEEELNRLLGLPTLATVVVIRESDYSNKRTKSSKRKGRRGDVTITQEAEA